MAIRLKEAGIDDFTVLERADEVGGTWRDNTYPDCACDVPSHLYSFSFAPNPDWSRTFSAQPEIWDYLRRVTDDHGVRPYIRFGHDLTEAVWNAGRGMWELETSRGALTAQVLVAGMGALSEPALPAIPGLDSFEGAMFHSATWDHDHDLTGDRVAVIGTGASAIQFVPAIQRGAARLHVFQRTPPWIMPRPDRPVTSIERRVYRTLPAAQRLMRAGIYAARELLVLGFMHPWASAAGPERLARRHLARQVSDPGLRAKLTPDYTFGCKRVLISDDYLPALTRPNVEVVTSPISEIGPRSVVTADGTERVVDTIILGTGFRVTDTPAAARLRGRGGRLLAEVWHGSPQAHRGTTVAGFPNLFMLVGPNTGLGHNSIIYMIESQLEYVMGCLRAMEARGAGTAEVRPEAQAAYNEALQAKTQGSVWTRGGCRSWYLGADGRNRVLWPGFSWLFRRATRRFDPAEYILEPKAVAT